MITICGEALVDLVGLGGQRFAAYPGGSPFNVAIGLARLSVPTSFLGRVSRDAFGRLLAERLARDGVHDRDLVAAAENTTLAVVSLDRDGGAEYRFYVEGTADWQWRAGELPDPLPADVTALHTGSLASWLPPGCDAIEAMLRRERDRGAVTISYDPNVRPRLMGEPDAYRPRVERLVGLADLVKVSEEDLRWLYPDREPARVAGRWTAGQGSAGQETAGQEAAGQEAVGRLAGQGSAAGPALVVLTRGAAGAAAFCPDGRVVRRPGRPVTVADTVGAGDAFTAGMLAWLAAAALTGPGSHPRLSTMDNESLGRMLDFAGLVAAVTCTRAGADPPYRDDLPADVVNTLDPDVTGGSNLVRGREEP